MSVDDQAAGTDLAEAERRVTELAGWLRLISAPGRTGKVTLEREDAAALVAMVAEYDRRGTELDRLAVRAQQHANATSWAAREAVAHMQKGDDLADQRAALSSLLRGMARRAREYRIERAGELIAALDGAVKEMNAARAQGGVMTRETAVEILLLHADELTEAVGGMHRVVALDALRTLGVTEDEIEEAS